VELKWNILLKPGNFSIRSAKTPAERVSNYNLKTKGNKIKKSNDKTTPLQINTQTRYMVQTW